MFRKHYFGSYRYIFRSHQCTGINQTMGAGESPAELPGQWIEEAGIKPMAEAKSTESLEGHMRDE